jgi:hypothetical protein
VRVTPNERAEIAASVAAHTELGPYYDSAVAEGLIERIGEEIDRRVDARLGSPRLPFPSAPAPSAPAASAAPAVSAVPERRSNGVTGMILGLGSTGIGVGATGAVVSHHAAALAQVLMVLLIWAAIAVVNVAHSQRR